MKDAKRRNALRGLTHDYLIRGLGDDDPPPSSVPPTPRDPSAAPPPPSGEEVSRVPLRYAAHHGDGVLDPD